MKKNLYTLALLLGSALGQVTAQTVIQDGNNWPAIGLTGSVKSASVSPGAGGANATWDFSTTSFSTLGTFEIVTPSTGPQQATYSAANRALKFTAGGTDYFQYFVNTVDSLALIGSDVTAMSTAKDYTPNPSRTLQYPFAYTDSYTDYYQKQGFPVDVFTATYDGYGTLIIDGNTYSNVVRVEYDYSGDKDYVWWSLNPLMPILNLNSSNTAIYFGIGATASVDVTEAKNVTATVYPNPSAGELTVEYHGQVAASIVFINSLGQPVFTTEVIGGKNTIDLSTLTSGVYFYSILEGDKKIITERLIIK